MSPAFNYVCLLDLTLLDGVLQLEAGVKGTLLSFGPVVGVVPCLFAFKIEILTYHDTIKSAFRIVPLLFLEQLKQSNQLQNTPVAATL